MERNAPTGSDVNPLKSDFELQTLLKKLHKVKKYKTFQRWKAKFLDRLEQFLYEKGMDPAEKSCDAFALLLTKFVKTANGVATHIEKGDLCDDKKTVKASLALNEMCSSLTKVVSEVELLIPSRKSEEKKKGFSKFHLGAALIRQGFHQYAKMKAIEDALSEIGAQLTNVADRQQHELFEQYKTQVQRFCDVMADLSLYEVMLKCIEFAEEPEEEESSDEEDITIEISVETPEGTKTLKLEIDPMEKIGTIKDTIAESCGIPAEKQVMKFKGKELTDNSATVKSVGIENRAKLSVESFKIPITVNTYDGKDIEVLVDPSIYMSDLKRLIEEEAGVPAKNQSLSMDGKELDNDFLKAEDYGVTAGSNLYMEPKSIGINVNMPDGSSHSFEVSMSDTPESIKAMIANETGMPAGNQLLNLNGKQLLDGKPMRDLGVRSGSTLQVTVLKIPVIVETYDGKRFEVEVDPRSYLSDIKRQVESETNVEAINQRMFMSDMELSDDNMKAIDYGIEAGSILFMEPKSMNVTVQMPDGKMFTVGISPSETIGAVKDKIADCSGMSRNRQVVKHNGSELTSGTKVKDTGVKDGSTVTVEVFKVPVSVNTHDGNTIEIQVDPTQKLAEFKKQLEIESGLLPQNQKLSFEGEVMLNDNKALNEYGIKAGSQIDLEPMAITISVQMPDGKVFTVGVSPSENIGAVKDKIADCSGMASNRQVLKHDGTELTNATKVKDTGIKDGSMVTVEVFKVPVTVNSHDGRTIEVLVDPTKKLAEFKKQLEEDSGLPWQNQKLSFEGDVMLNDNQALNDYGIKAGSHIDLAPMAIKIGIEMPDGKKHSIEISPLDTAEMIKQKIEQRTGMKVPRQVLKLNGSELPDDKSAKSIGLEDGSELKVEVFTVPVVVRSMDGEKVKVMIDPTQKLSGLKHQLESHFDVPAPNQRLFMQGTELTDNNKSAHEHGIKAGSELYLEPKVVEVNVKMPDGSIHAVNISPENTSAEIKAAIAAETGVAAPRQILRFNGRDIAEGQAARDLGVRKGSSFEVSLFTIPVSVKAPDGRTHSLHVEPSDTVDSLKKLVEKETGIPAKKQCLKLNGDELNEGKRSVDACGVKARSLLTLERISDHIIFVDVKCGTLFAMERDLVIERGALTPHQNNKLDFMEAATDSASRDKARSAMMESPRLGLATQVVVEKGIVDDYEMEEAEKVKNMWGVNLKKREKNKAGEELIFVDPKTGACGELSRKKYIELNFITPIGNGREESIAEAEKDTMTYDKYITEMRNLFGVKLVK